MTQEDKEFDFQEALKAIQDGKPFMGKDGVLTPLIKKLTEAALEGELDSHLGKEIAANRRNGKSKKTIKSQTSYKGFNCVFYSNIENLALWARSQFSGFTI
ncbi:MAG: hypothetical protein KAI50_14560 [Desulfobacterales bacterium]|nr:hypothetical protein [Desulfobacterales bacterium]